MAAKLKTRHLTELVSIADPRLAPTPAGERPARAVVTVTDVVPGEKQEPPRYRSRLALVDLGADAGEPRLRTLTFGEQDRAPRWSPDGRRIAFLRGGRDPKGAPIPARLAVLDLEGGEARVLTEGPNPVTAFAWRDDAHLFIVTRGERKDEDVERGLARIVDRRWHRLDGVGFLPDPDADLVQVALADGSARKLATLAHAPDDIAVAPGGRRLAYLAPTDDAEFDAGVERLWTLRLGRKRAEDPEDLLGEVLRGGGNLAWSPDGARLAFLAPSDLTGFGRSSSLWLSRRGGGAPRRLTEPDVETSATVAGDVRRGAYPITPRWSADGRSLTVMLNRTGRSQLARVGVGRSPVVEPLGGGDRVVSAFDASDGWALQIVETPTAPGELFLRAPDGDETRLTDLNDGWTRRFRLAAPVERRFSTADGTALAYLWYAPAKPRRDRAVVIQVHGGPHTNDGFGFRFEYQRLLAAGYAVVALNPRGSTSFGEAHATAMLLRYGTIDADDVMAVVEHALAHHERPDAPVHLTGGSYGGFMTNWLVGQHPERFRSAVTQRSISNWVSFYGTSDIGPWFTENEVGPAPWVDLEALWRASPLRYVENVVTPTLVIHSENDHRCPIEQAEQWFTALKQLGRAETRLARFPEEGHELSRGGRPDRRIQRIDLILDWFERHA
ncbi:MAG: S9 family peptidase [Trueperaceae bacterium]